MAETLVLNMKGNFTDRISPGAGKAYRSLEKLDKKWKNHQTEQPVKRFKNKYGNFSRRHGDEENPEYSFFGKTAGKKGVYCQS